MEVSTFVVFSFCRDVLFVQEISAAVNHSKASPLVSQQRASE